MMRMASITSLSFSKTTPLTTNLLHQPPENVLMPIRDLTFRRIPTIHLIKFNNPKFISSLNNNIAAVKNPMAEEATSNKINTIESTMNNNKATELDKNQEKSKVNIPPPPPEKPLPDDCCGSGCVRCVWDMYYEELEEYNKLYKSIPDTKAS